MSKTFLQFCQDLKNNESIFVGRLSGNETALCGLVINNIKPSNLLISNMLYVAGIFFEDDESILKYCRMYLESVKNCTYLGVWEGNMRNQAHHFYNILSTDSKFRDINCIPARYLEPFYFMDDNAYMFNQCLDNKTVLIVSSHIDTMKEQEPLLNNIFSKSIFDKCKKIKYLRPPATHCGRHNNIDWSHNFHQFCNQLEEDTDFDIALVSCGGYGMITCNFISKKLGKKTLYVGGGLQLYFGIKGRRWDNYGWYNEYWISPKEHEIPKNKELAEGGCYW